MRSAFNPRARLRSGLVRASLVASLGLTHACAVGHCTRNTDCPHGESCIDTLCVAPEVDAGLDAGFDAGADATVNSPSPTGGTTPVVEDASTPADATMAPDAASPDDAATPVDAAVPTDANVPSDASVTGDADVPSDSAVPMDAAALLDAMVDADAGSTGP